MVDFSEYHLFILSELKRLNENLEKYQQELKQQNEKYHSLEKQMLKRDVKSSFWGSLGGAISTVVLYFGKVLFE